MDTAAARVMLMKMTAATVDPVLSDADIDALLSLARRPDRYGSLPLLAWAASTTYTIFSERLPATANGHYYRVSTAGVSGATAPTWPTTSGATVTDGTVVWTEAGAYLWTPTYNLRAAAAEGWRWKAAAVAADFAFTADGSTYERDQMIKQCLDMVKQYSNSISSVSLQGASARRVW